MINYNEEQLWAISKVHDFLVAAGPGDEFLLSGSAGTGKTSCIDEVRRRYVGKLAFTAPTNKATKVLRGMLPPGTACMTTYSLLGMRLDASGEIKEITKAMDKPPISRGITAVVVDEGSMANLKLRTVLKEEATRWGVAIVYMGDPAQLPPVKEVRSPIWDIPDTNRAHLNKVMRHDNQILRLAVHIRERVDNPFPNYAIRSDFDANGGVQRLARPMFDQLLREAARRGEFTSGASKAIAWRNVVVDKMNKLIRQELMGITVLPYVKNDRIIALSPCMKQSGEEDITLLHTDDEAVVMTVQEDRHPKHLDYQVLRLVCARDGDEEDTVILHALHPDAQALYKKTLQGHAAEREWKRYWSLKEAFHEVRHAYAITAHRSQGSTYESTYVDFADILWNPNRPEAARCLYVACTRSKKNLFLTG